MAKIMVIEDNEIHKTLICHGIEDMMHEPVPCADLDAAEKALAKETPDLFIIDVHLHDAKKPTFDFLKELSKSKYTKNIPVIVVSAYVTEKELVDAVPSFDKTNLLKKPFKMETITQKIDKLLKKRTHH